MNKPKGRIIREETTTYIVPVGTDVYVSDDEMMVQKHTTQNENQFTNGDLLLSMESVFKIPDPDGAAGGGEGDPIPVPLSELTHLRFFTFKTGNTDWPYMMVAQDVFTTYKRLDRHGPLQSDDYQTSARYNAPTTWPTKRKKSP